MKIVHAVSIDLGDDTIPDNADVGLSGGVFRWISGRPGISGWKEGILADQGFGTVQESVEISDGGVYAPMSSTDVTVVGPSLAWGNLGDTVLDFQSYLLANGFHLERKTMVRYVIFDGGDPVPVWTGAIESVEHDETTAKINGMDDQFRVHGNVPRTIVSPEQLPDAPDDSMGQPDRIAIGRVSAAKLLPVTGRVDRVNIFQRSGIPYQICRAKQYYDGTQPTLILETGSAYFEAADLIGKYIRVVRTGTTDDDISIGLIEWSSESIIPPRTPEAGTTLIQLSGVFTKDGVKVNAVAGDPVNDWWFEVYSFSDFRELSEGPIYGFPDGQGGFTTDHNKGLLQGWNDTAKVLFDVTHKRIASYGAGDAPDSIGVGERSGFQVRPSGEDVASQPSERFVLTPTQVYCSGHTGPNLNYLGGGTPVGFKATTSSNPFPKIAGDAGLLADRSTDTLYTSNYQGTGFFGLGFLGMYSAYGRVSEAVSFDFVLDPSFVMEDGEELSFSVDTDVTLQFPNASHRGGEQIVLTCQASLVSIYGDVIYSANIPLFNVSLPNTTTTPTTENVTIALRDIGSFYYGAGSNTGTNRPLDAVFTGSLSDANSRARVSAIRITLGLSLNVPGRLGYSMGTVYGAWNVRQIMLARESDAYAGDLFATCLGVPFDSDWDGRRTEGDPILLPSDAIEYLIRVEDGKPARVDTASFDKLRTARNTGWEIGTQITEIKNTSEYIDDLCKHCFMACFPGADGKRVLKKLDNYGAYEDHEPFPVFLEKDIISGSFDSVIIGGLDRIYTSVEFSYDYSAALDDYQRVLKVINEDEDSFPHEDATSNGIPIWTLWVSETIDYRRAKALWEKCHAAYLRAGQKRPYTLELPWFGHRGDWESAPNYDAPHQLAKFAMEWLGHAWLDYSFRIPLTADNLAATTLLSRIGVGDQIRSALGEYYTMITGRELDPVANEIHITASRRVDDAPYAEIPTYISDEVEGVISDYDTISDIPMDPDHLTDPTTTNPNTITSTP